MRPHNDLRQSGQRVSIEQACKGGMGVQGKGGAHLLVDDADVVLGAISFQGVS